MFKRELRILREDKTRICSCCGTKIEPKIARVVLSPEIYPRTFYLCQQCQISILTNYFLNKGEKV